MSQVIDSPLDFISFDRGRISRKVISHTVPGFLILAVSALVGAGMLSMRPVAVPKFYMRSATAPEAAKAPAVAPAVKVASNAYGVLFDPRSATGATPPSLAQNFPLEADLELDASAPSVATAEPENGAPTPAPEEPQLGENVPLPAPRPPELAAPAGRGPVQNPSRRLAEQEKKSAPLSAPPDNRNLLEKLFGMQQQPPGRVLAYAAPEGGLSSPVSRITTGASPRVDQGTAVYDVAAHTVYMPDGTRLEAHSGLGDRMDNPRYVNERMRGATPPNVYELSLREQLFHGVQALRLTPVGGGTVYGRTGLLAHTYMLGPNGASNGCVSFRNYQAFLQAYQKGQIKRLVVVARN